MSTATARKKSSVTPKTMAAQIKGKGKASVTKSAALQAGQLEFSVETVTPEIAQEWLERNASNRNVRPRKILEFRRDMIGGNWRAVGDPIRFDLNGDLIDGQHRLLALVQAGEEMPGLAFSFMVVRGVEPDDRVVIDTGTRRTAADQLKMAGYKNHALLAAAAKWCAMWDRNVIAGDLAARSATHAEVLEYVEQNPALISITDTVNNRMRQHVDMPGGYIAAAYFLCQRIDDSDAFEFFERLVDGVGLSSGDPILALRSRLRELDKAHANLNGDAWLSLVLRAWNARREGRTMRVLPLEKSGRPIPAPNPI